MVIFNSYIAYYIYSYILNYQRVLFPPSSLCIACPRPKCVLSVDLNVAQRIEDHLQVLPVAGAVVHLVVLYTFP